MKSAKRQNSSKHIDSYPVPRVYRRKGRGIQSAHLLIKCGDCNQKFKIYYGADGEDLEIAGVLASIENWRKILLPLLKNRPSRDADSYAVREYGVIEKELDRFARRTKQRIARQRKAGKMTIFSGDLEADIAR